MNGDEVRAIGGVEVKAVDDKVQGGVDVHVQVEVKVLISGS
jgi:hypothetical protein